MLTIAFTQPTADDRPERGCSARGEGAVGDARIEGASGRRPPALEELERMASPESVVGSRVHDVYVTATSWGAGRRQGGPPPEVSIERWRRDDEIDELWDPERGPAWNRRSTGPGVAARR